jgi:hypothetical protein
VPAAVAAEFQFEEGCSAINVSLPSLTLTESTEAVVKPIDLVAERSWRMAKGKGEEADRPCTTMSSEHPGNCACSSRTTREAESVMAVVPCKP